jgi:hypothetical protein
VNDWSTPIGSNIVSSMVLDGRQTPRLPLRVPAQLAFGAGRLVVVAEDFAAGGCGLVAPLALRRGQPVFLSMRIPGAPEFASHATVAWASAATPHRTGVSFGPDRSPEREESLRAILAALSPPTRATPALRPDTWLRATRAAESAALGREEREVLVAAMEGGTVRELLERACGPGARRALLLLHARGLVAEGIGPPRQTGRAVPADDFASDLELLCDFPRPAPRSRWAAACLEMARSERAAGHLAAAVEWLQGAAEEAPDDPEIGAELDALTLVIGY